MTLSATLVTLVVIYLIPAVTALLTKANASVGLKQFVTALLSAASAMLVTATQLDGTAVISKQSVVLALASFLASQAAYRGLYRPHAINAKLAPNVGLGGPTVEPG